MCYYFKVLFVGSHACHKVNLGATLEGVYTTLKNWQRSSLHVIVPLMEILKSVLIMIYIIYGI